MGRRIQKIVSTNNGIAWIAISTNRYVYDGWNLIATLDSQSSILQSFTWGKDLSGSLQGAGGVGGLLSTIIHSGPNAGTYFYCFDGNGNVAALANAANGTMAGQWEYDPFGNAIRASGPLAKANPFLFSTKFFDAEIGLYSYAFRYYDSSSGRWLNNDPCGENGGINLYGFAHNNPINWFDSLGLQVYPGSVCWRVSVDLNQNITGHWSTAPIDLEDGTGFDMPPPPSYISQHDEFAIDGLIRGSDMSLNSPFANDIATSTAIILTGPWLGGKLAGGELAADVEATAVSGSKVLLLEQGSTILRSVKLRNLKIAFWRSDIQYYHEGSATPLQHIVDRHFFNSTATWTKKALLCQPADSLTT